MLLSVLQAAERLGVKPGTVRALIAARRLRHCRVGLGRGVLRIPVDALDEYVRSVTIGVEEKGAASPPGGKKEIRLRHLRF